MLQLQRNEVISGLFVKSKYAIIGNEDFLGDNNISVIISVLTDEEYEENDIHPDIFLKGTEWYRIVLDDTPKAPIWRVFYKVHAIIKESLMNEQNVLVHCAGGMSRSPTLVIAYLMIEKKWSFEEAYEYLRKARSIVEPNPGFVKQLEYLEKSILEDQNKNHENQV